MTFSARAGYSNGFYASGPSYSAAVFGAQFGYRYAPAGHVALLYNYIHNDSINANYFRDHQFYATIEHAFAPFDVFAQGGVIIRQYAGVITQGPPVMYGTGIRDDLLGTATLELRYNFRDWLAASASYLLLIDSTDYTYMTPDGSTINPSYVQHEVLAGVRAAY
jgi:hypothetical protein